MDVLDQPQILRALFHPRRENLRNLLPPGVREIAIKAEPGLTIGGRLYPAAPTAPATLYFHGNGEIAAPAILYFHGNGEIAAPAILYFHGNGEIAADYDTIASLYTRIGVTLLIMDYRGYGQSDGVPTARNTLTDAVAAFDAAGRIFAENGLAPTRLYVMGRSLGSAAAIEVALHAGEQLAGLIVESGFANTFALLARLGARVRGVDVDETCDGFGNPAKIARTTTRTLVIHGQDDVLIPASDGQELYRRCAASDKQLLLIPRAGHNDLMMVGMTEYFEAIRAFVHDVEQT